MKKSKNPFLSGIHFLIKSLKKLITLCITNYISLILKRSLVIIVSLLERNKKRKRLKRKMDLLMLHKFPANMAINKMKRQNMNKMLKKIYLMSKQNLTIQL
jgi:hypothetical protein